MKENPHAEWRAYSREAILNAVVHKDYASNVPIQISVYPDKLMIWNSGQLPTPWTVDWLMSKHSSVPFNPDFATTFFRAGMIEAWGRGIERIQEACALAGVQAPEFMGLVEMTIPDKPQSRLQKYRLTDAGLIVVQDFRRVG